MPEHLHFEDDALVNRETHHEETDVPMKALLWFGIVVVVLGLVIHLLVWGIFKGLAAYERKQSREAQPLTAIARPLDASVPAEPRLQPFPRKTGPETFNTPYTNTPVTDLAAMRAREEGILHHYGWVDPQKQVVHIPIEQAKELALQRGVFHAPATEMAQPLAPAPQQNTAGADGVRP
ncbi:MAG TPA: hypothetical protein VGR02_12790 [Thermoanaerobaculia bacterium]|jgi:hypothetical protein|nr:hypothetical protein [Thermoanaerobaculia bacterium]